MLVMTLKEGQVITINKNISIALNNIKSSHAVSIGIDAPKDVMIRRNESFVPPKKNTPQIKIKKSKLKINCG